MSGIDTVQIAFNQNAQLTVKVIAGLILFSLALSIHPDDLKRLAQRPRDIGLVVVVQFLLVPFFTIAVIRLLDVRPSVALGMLLVACCPSGKISNILTLRSHGDVPLSVSMSLVSNLATLAALPAAFPLWARFDPRADKLLHDIHLSTGSFGVEVAGVVALPILLGILVAARWPAFAEKLRRPLGSVGLALLLLVIGASFVANWSVFKTHLPDVFHLVLLQDGLSFLAGYGVARGVRMDQGGTRALTFEVGVRNTGLGLVLALAFFPHLGGMALVLAWWSIWDVVAGIALAAWWGRRGTGKLTPALSQN